MQTPNEALTVQAIKLEAANEEFVSVPADDGASRGGSARGWDPYEVWRVRIKEPQERLWPRPPPR